MNDRPYVRSGCSDEYAELCALAATDALSREESLELQRHLASCDSCRALLAEYKALASDGMAKLGAELSVARELEAADPPWDETAARARIVRQLQSNEEETVGPPLPQHASASHDLAWPAVLKIAAVVVAAVLLGYGFGFRKGTGNTKAQNASFAIEQQLRQLRSERDTLSSELSANSKTISDLNDRTARDERDVIELKETKTSLESAMSHLSSQNEQQATSLDSVAAQRDDLQRKLQDATLSLQKVRDDLNRSQEEHQKALLQTASLETRISELTSELRESNASSDREKDFLASDRDIRDLMGARNLYIADVFDVDHNGKKRKPFGRVFYTKGKSLVFYAFDLDEQPGARNAKAFQAWGSPSEDQTSPVSLGVFYMDSEANRRWVLKSDDPAVLAQINALFVTVEPNGASKSPTGKPFLYAYLRTAPTNHP